MNFDQELVDYPRDKAMLATALQFECDVSIHNIEFDGLTTYFEHMGDEAINRWVWNHCKELYKVKLTEIETDVIVDYIKQHKSIESQKHEGYNECHCEFFKRIGNQVFCRHLDLMSLGDKATRLEKVKISETQTDLPLKSET